MLAIKEAQQEIAQLCSVREEQVKHSIRGEVVCRALRHSRAGAAAGPPDVPVVWLFAELSERVEEAEARAVYPEEEGAHECRVGELNTAAEEAKENIDRLNQELR